MSDIVCYVPVKGIDDVIADKLGRAYTPYRIATLRGMYDTKHKDSPLDTSDLGVAAAQLANFNRQQIIDRTRKIKETATNLADSYRKLRREFSAEERFNRVNMLAYIFSLKLDALQRGTPNVDRTQIANGYLDADGKSLGGEIRIFENIYSDLLNSYGEATANNDTERAKKLQKVLDNWPALVTFARIKLRDTEGLVLGAKSNYSKETDFENFSDDDLTQVLFDLSESKREGWQEVTAAISSFGSLGKDVRRFLSTIPVVELDEKGNLIEVKDDLGIPKMLDPVKAHQALLDLLRGCTSKQSMFNRLRSRAGQAIWLRPIIKKLTIPAYSSWESLSENEQTTFNNIEQLKTKLYVDLKKNFQPYSIMKREKRNGIQIFKTILLNKNSEDDAINKYMSRVAFGNPTSESSILEDGGSVNWERLQQLRDLIKDNISAPAEKVDRSVEGNALKQQPSTISGFLRASKASKIDFIVKTANLLDISITPDAAERLLYNRKDLRKYLRALEDLNYKILPGIMKGKTSIEGVKTFKDLITRTVGSGKNEVSLKDRIKVIAGLGVKYVEGSRFERACRYTGSKKKGVTYYSDVNPSYLGDEIDTIQEYVDANDEEGLKRYIREKYLGTSYFTHDGRILNWWIRDLYEGGTEDSSFAANFTSPDRFLGENGNEFENFTSKMHAEALFSKYFAIRQQNASSDEAWRKDYAEYPIFILGDSGVAKFVKAKRYDSYDSTDKLLDGFYDVYRQELRRKALIEATTKKMNPWAVREDGSLDWSKVTVKIDNFTDTYNKFTFLPFLNKDYKDSKGKVEPKYANMLSENPTEAEVKAAIKEYMKDAQAAFVDRMVEYGVVTKTTTKDGKVSYYSPALAQEIGKGKTFEQVIQDYFWNTKFATIQQLQMFTVDPAFYKGTKDLQKRYKEIHAPGSKLDIAAKWNDELVAGNNPIERVIYFDDINVNGENIDTEFMNAILYNYAEASREEVDKAIADKITTPRDNEEEEAQRIKTLKSLLGKNWGIYDSYRKNTLTDGQGYRTLQSYRKVMIMAGKWDDTMERYYNELQNIRRAYRKDGDVPKEVMKKIAAMAVVFMPIKPYMYTFENYALSGEDKLMIPVQHKYAEAVLIPELLPKGSKLRDMAYMMEEHTEDDRVAPIDMICSTKAVKVGGFGAADISKATNNEELVAALNKGYVHQLSYSDYRIQTNVPEHINGSQLFGTQVRKLIMAGIKMASDYGRYTGGKVPRLYKNQAVTTKKLTGFNLVQFYNALIVANILDSFDNFAEGITSPEALSDALIQSTISNSRESIDNLLSFALDGSSNFTIPLFEGGLEHDSAALVFSIFRKLVNKQKINGGSAVQVSAMGISGYEEDGGLRYVTDPNNKENIHHAECEIPFDLSYIDDNGQTVELEYDDWVNNDGTPKVDKDGVPLLEKEFPGILDIIAYRIPTERDYSMINLKVVRFSRKEAGGTIKVPPQGTTISGFDFDIDKLYFMRKQFRRRSHYVQEGFSQAELYKIFGEIYDKHPEIKASLERIRENSGDNKALNAYWDQMLEQNPSLIADPAYNKDNLFTEAVNSLVERGELDIKERRKEYSLDEYDFNKTPLENSKIARNNMLINLIQQRLQDPETFKQRYTPGGFANASKAARVMRELIFGDLSSIKAADGKIDYSKLYRRAENKNADPEPNYDPSDPLTIITYNQQNQVAGKLIGIFANQNTNHAFASLMGEMVIKEGMDFGFCGHRYSDFLHAPEGIDVDLNVAEFLAASVDAVKDPVLNFLNLNTLTADAGATLARLGYTTEEIGLLFNQPIIKEICDYAFNNNVSIDVATRNVVKEYENTAKVSANDVKDSDSDFTKDRLVDGIVSGRERRENSKGITQGEAIQQIKVANLFSKISTVSRDLSEFVTSTKFTASNAAGSTFGDYYAQQLKVKDYIARFNKDSVKQLSIQMQVSPFVSMPINNNDDYLSNDKEEYLESLMPTPFAYEQAMFDMNRKALRMLSKYYPYETKMYVEMRQRMNDLVRYGHLDAATINSLHNEIIVHLLSQQENSIFNGEGTVTYKDKNGNTVSTTNRELYTKVFPDWLREYKETHPEVAKLAIFEYLDFSYNDETKTTTLTIQNIGGLKPYQKDELRDSWSELMKISPAAARGLFMYNFYKLGFTFSPQSFMNIAPTEVKEQIMVGNISYVDFLRKVQRGEMGINLETFARHYILNHTENSRFVYTVFGEDKTTIEKLYLDPAKNPKAEFVLDISNFGNEAKGFTINGGNADKRLTAFPAVIAIPYTLPDGSEGTHYYMASGNTDKFNVSSDKTMKYVYVRPLGVTNSSLQYPGVTEKPTSIAQSETPVSTGNTNNIPEVNNEIQSMDTEDIIKEIAIELARGYQRIGVDVDAEMLARGLSRQSRDDLETAIAAIRKACRENGILVLNEDGLPMMGC